MAATQLWIGEHEALVQKVYVLATEVFGGAHQESICNRQFYGVHWFSPEKNNYTKADLEPLFHRLSFGLGPDEIGYVVLEHADLLSVICANSLLKLLEEPPVGYSIILLAENKDMILPTIRSRCIISEFYSPDVDQDFVMFLSHFKNPVAGAHIQVMQDFEKTKMTEYQARRAVDELYRYWVDQHKKALLNQDELRVRKTERMMRICAHVAEQPPMPGGIKLFWRTLYLLMVL